MKSYKLSHADTKWYFDVQVHETKDQMHAAIQEWYEGIEDPNKYSDCLGMVCPSMNLMVDGEDLIAKGNYAMVFLNEEHLTFEILTHECGHIAFAYERSVSEFDMSYGESCGENEERFAYALGRISAGLIETLIQGGHKIEHCQ